MSLPDRPHICKVMNYLRFSVWSMVALACMVIGCKDKRDRQMIEKQGDIAAEAIRTIPLLQQFCSRFADGHHFISYVTGKESQTTWNSKVGLFGRYVIDMQVRTAVDRSTLKLSLVGTAVSHHPRSRWHFELSGWSAGCELRTVIFGPRASLA